MLHFVAELFKICFVLLTSLMASDPMPMVTLKYFYHQPQNEYARCIAYVSGQNLSRELELFVITKYNLSGTKKLSTRKFWRQLEFAVLWCSC